jgi:hypothetical protein
MCMCVRVCVRVFSFPSLPIINIINAYIISFNEHEDKQGRTQNCVFYVMGTLAFPSAR